MGHEHVVVRAEDTMVLQAAQYGISEKMARQVLGVTEPDIVFEDELESSEDEARGGTRCAHVALMAVVLVRIRCTQSARDIGVRVLP